MASKIKDWRTMNDKTFVSRRTILKGSLFVGAAATAGGSYSLTKGIAFAADEPSADKAHESSVAQEGIQYGFLACPIKCTNCLKCIKACKRANKTPDKIKERRQVVSHTDSSGEEVFVPVSCMHCQNPSCATACPAGAVTKRGDGIVVVDQGLCIGCKYCYFACPFGIPQYSSEGMDKCDCCIGAGVPVGEMPNCVQACEFDALTFGTIDELEAQYGTAKRLEAPTGPSLLLV